MKHIKLFEEFSKKYMEKMPLEDFKKIKKGDSVLYMGSRYTVKDANEAVIKLSTEGSQETISVNYNMFNHGGAITESVTVTADVAKQLKNMSGEKLDAQEFGDYLYDYYNSPDDYDIDTESEYYRAIEKGFSIIGSPASKGAINDQKIVNSDLYYEYVNLFK